MIAPRSIDATIFRTSPRNSCGEIPHIVRNMHNPATATTPRSYLGHGVCTFLFDPAADPLAEPARWRAEASPFVLRVRIPPGARRISGTVLQGDLAGGKKQYLVMRGAFGAHRVELAVEPDCERPSIALCFDAWLPSRLSCLEALASGKPDLPLRARPTPYQAGRLGLLLAILDRLEDERNGPAKLRDIATGLVFPGADLATRTIEWKSSSLRRQTQRLVASAKSLRDHGYRHLLHGRLLATSPKPAPLGIG